MSTQPTEPAVAHVILTTHWDREWVQPFEQYRLRLVQLIDGLLEVIENEPDTVFFFDGQTVVIEDYLEVRPQRREALLHAARAGKIRFGPWYVLADQFLQCDEATVRNLLIGCAIAETFGGAVMHGYNPDSFGSIATLPAILNGFGIRSCNFGRGKAQLQPRGDALFRWRGRDGSEVLALARGYANAIELTYPDMWRDISQGPPPFEGVKQAAQKIIEKEKRWYPVPVYYLSAGVDHMPPRGGLAGHLRRLNEQQQAVRYELSDPLRYMQAAEAALEQTGAAVQSVCGEMRGDATSPMDLQGVLSTNQRIKRLNRECEIMLIRLLEPLAAHYAQHASAAASESVADLLRHAWKLLLRNHAHDSICACSRDEVMADVEARFQHVRQIGVMLGERLMRDVLERRFPKSDRGSETAGVTLFNTICHRGRSAFDSRVRVPLRLDDSEYDLVDTADRVVGSARVVAVKNIDLESYYATDDDLPRMLSKDSPPQREPRQCYTVLDVRGVHDFGSAAGFHTFALRPRQQPTHTAAEAAAEFQVGPRSLANALVELTFAEDGSLTLHHKPTGRGFSRMGWFEDSADIGDTYDYRAGGGTIDSLNHSVAVRIGAARIENQRICIETEVDLDIPAASDQHGRSGKLLRHTLRSTYTLHAGCAAVQVQTRFINAAVNHRLRVGFSLPAAAVLHSGGHFAAMPRQWIGDDQPFPTRPMTDYLHADCGARGQLGIFVRGLYEFEPRKTQDHALYITICRSVDRIGDAAGANYPVEHAKQLGQQHAEYAIAFVDSLTHCVHTASACVTPVLAAGHLPASPGASPWIEIDSDDVIITSIKPAERGGGTIIRFFNPTDQPGELVLTHRPPAESVWRTNLAEQYRRPLAPGPIDYGPHEIVSLLLEACGND